VGVWHAWKWSIPRVGDRDWQARMRSHDWFGDGLSTPSEIILYAYRMVFDVERPGADQV
jgi:hypothetical protein